MTRKAKDNLKIHTTPARNSARVAAEEAIELAKNYPDRPWEEFPVGGSRRVRPWSSEDLPITPIIRKDEDRTLVEPRR